MCKYEIRRELNRVNDKLTASEIDTLSDYISSILEKDSGVIIKEYMQLSMSEEHLEKSLLKVEEERNKLFYNLLSFMTINEIINETGIDRETISELIKNTIWWW